MTTLEVPARVADAGRVSRRRAELIATATRLFGEKGYHATTVRDIASAAGWQMGTLYLYVKSKEDLLYLVHDDVYEQYLAALHEGQPCETATESLRHAMSRAVFTIDRLHREVRTMHRQHQFATPGMKESLRAREIAVREFFASIIRRGIASGEFGAVDPVLYGHFCLVMAASWGWKRWALQPEYALDTYASHITALLLARLDPAYQPAQTAIAPPQPLLLAPLEEAVRVDVPARVTDTGRVARRRGELVAVARRLFLEKGFHATTVRDIAAAAGWQMGTLYLYVPAKEDLLYLAFDSIMDEAQAETVITESDEGAETQFVRLVGEIARTMDRLHVEIVMMFRESGYLRRPHREAVKARDQQDRARVASLVERGIAVGEFRENDAVLVAHHVTTLIAAWALKRPYLDTLYPLETYVSEAVSLFLASLRR